MSLKVKFIVVIQRKYGLIPCVCPG